MTNHRCDPTESFEEREAFEENGIHRLKDAKCPSIKQRDRDAFLPE
jgi:hypothetical protein